MCVPHRSRGRSKKRESGVQESEKVRLYPTGAEEEAKKREVAGYRRVKMCVCTPPEQRKKQKKRGSGVQERKNYVLYPVGVKKGSELYAITEL